MNKIDLVREVSKKTNFTQENAEIAVTAAIEAISEALQNFEPIAFQGLGSFKPVTRKAKTMYCGITGGDINVPERHTYKFNPASIVKDALTVE